MRSSGGASIRPNPTDGMRHVLLIGLVLLAACGEDQPAPSDPDARTRLEIEVRPRGEAGPARRRIVTDPPAGITPADFAPVAPDRACAQVYGGPATARVEGTLDGERVDATFNRVNACEMTRWDRLEALLGPAPGAAR